MKKHLFNISLSIVALAFTIIFGILIIPALIQNPDVLSGFAGGFVNPFSSGYAIDAICCWVILLIWIIYEAPKVKYGWICILLGIVPGVAVGFSLYLILRTKQLNASNMQV